MQSVMTQFIGELIGTFMLVLLGNGIVAAVVLNKTKSNNAGWLSITIGWGFAVTVAVYISGFLSSAHLNPAVTLAMFATGSMESSLVLPYIAAQFLGAMAAAGVLLLHYYPHYKETKDAGSVLATFSTGPAIRHTWSNVLGEALGTAVLVIGIMSLGKHELTGGLAPIIVGLIVISIGLSLGGTTGYAINPARDLGPRIVHALLPVPNKKDSDWGYAWIPVVGPILGGVVGALLYNAIINMM